MPRSRSTGSPRCSASAIRSWTVAVWSIRARMPSAYAFCPSSERRTSGWRVIATRGESLSAKAARSGPCTLDLA